MNSPLEGCAPILDGYGVREGRGSACEGRRVNHRSRLLFFLPPYHHSALKPFTPDAGVNDLVKSKDPYPSSSVTPTTTAAIDKRSPPTTHTARDDTYGPSTACTTHRRGRQCDRCAYCNVSHEHPSGRSSKFLSFCRRGFFVGSVPVGFFPSLRIFSWGFVHASHS